MRSILEKLMVFHGEVGEMEDLFKGISREVKVKINGIFINLSLINIGGRGFMDVVISMKI